MICKEPLIKALQDGINASGRSYDFEKINAALALAESAHKGQLRASGEEYVCHPLQVAIILVELGMDNESIEAALLHDVVEDAGISMDEIGEKFGQRVRELVASETEDKRADLPPEDTWRIRKEESLDVLKNTDDMGILMVWLGDKLANMRAIYRDWKTEGDAMWERFNQKDKNEQAWYYRSIAKLTERLADTAAWIEYCTLTELVFGKGN